MILSYTILLVILLVTIALDKSGTMTFSGKPFYYLIAFGFVFITVMPVIAGLYGVVNDMHGIVNNSYRYY